MQIDIMHIAKLARLKMQPEEAEKFQGEMQAILEMVNSLPEPTGSLISVDAGDPMPLRPDVAAPSLRREELLQNAPRAQAGCIIVPKTVAE